ncbi:uncharacterized protein LOC115036327 isoform X3 [Echeneis naucrates]|uniref:uncharacterized protein LOC115036327 isoform X3 n=1 Tax=Echeneis naucrates TaxID=173247 RepID=UPI0011135091|nr:uncharacterized protein LOC115036327 isoform X3 [Echeneis naucrates]
MLLCVFLLFVFCESSVSLQTTASSVYIVPITMGATMKEMHSPLQAVAMPDYPVAAGQTVQLHCSAFQILTFANWSWQHLENRVWHQVGSERDLILTEPEQSGLYRCWAKTLNSELVSHNLTVYIIDMPPTDMVAHLLPSRLHLKIFKDLKRHQRAVFHRLKGMEMCT